jgi:hypothetical protein
VGERMMRRRKLEEKECKGSNRVKIKIVHNSAMRKFTFWMKCLLPLLPSPLPVCIF